MRKYNRELLKSQNGFSLVELMVVLALSGIILALGYNYFYFGYQSFSRGERYAIAQQASRYTSDFITTEIRFANEIEINPLGGVSADNYNYLYLENDSIKIYNAGNERTLADNSLDDIAYRVYFTSNVPNDVVYFYIFADLHGEINLSNYMYMDLVDNVWLLDETLLIEEHGEPLYFLKTKVQALNLELYNTYGQNEELIKLNGDGGTILKYKKPVE